MTDHQLDQIYKSAINVNHLYALRQVYEAGLVAGAGSVAAAAAIPQSDAPLTIDGPNGPDAPFVATTDGVIGSGDAPLQNIPVLTDLAPNQADNPPVVDPVTLQPNP